MQQSSVHTAAMTRLDEIVELEEELREIDVAPPPRPSTIGKVAARAHDGARKRRSAEEKHLGKLKRLCRQHHLASPPARAPRGSTTSGGRRETFRAAEARAAVELEEALEEAEKQ